jgi:hypothetical protein
MLRFLRYNLDNSLKSKGFWLEKEAGFYDFNEKYHSTVLKRISDRK